MLEGLSGKESPSEPIGDTVVAANLPALPKVTEIWGVKETGLPAPILDLDQFREKNRAAIAARIKR